MKKNKILTLLLALSCATSLLSSCNQEETTTPDVPNEEPDKVYKYKDPKCYEGTLISNLDLPLFNETTLHVPLLDTKINFTYQEIDQELNEDEDMRKIKFHLNMDLYSSKEMYESSVLSKYVLTGIFTDFKYQNILNNVSDIDFYYYGDGILYTTISRFENNAKPSRVNEDYLKTYPREIIGTSKIDISSLMDMVGSVSGDNSTDFIIQQLYSILSGFSVKIGDITSFIEGITINILDEGFNANVDQEGLNGLSSILTNLVNFVVNKFGIDVSLKDGNLLNINKFEVSYTPLSISANILSENSTSSLLNLSLTRNDNEVLNVESSVNLEEDYLIQEKAVKAVDSFYSLYDNYSLDGSSQTEIYNAISTINSLSNDEKARVANFNSYLGYDVLTIDENGNYTGISEEENIQKYYQDILDIINDTNETDYQIMTGLEKIFALFDEEKYSDSIKFNLLTYIQRNNEEEYSAYLTKISSFLNRFLDQILKDVNALLDEYNKDEEHTLNETHDLIEGIYNLTSFDKIVLSTDKEIELKDLKENDVIKALPSSIVSKIAYIFSLDHQIFDQTNAQNISSIIIKYLDEIYKIVINMGEKSDIQEFKDVPSYLLLNEDNDEMYNIFNLISNGNLQFIDTIKNKLDDIISDLLYKADLMANKKLDNTITIEEIRLIFNKDDLALKKKSLDGMYNMIHIYLSSPLYEKYEANLSYIDKYYELCNEFELQENRL